MNEPSHREHDGERGTMSSAMGLVRQCIKPAILAWIIVVVILLHLLKVRVEGRFSMGPVDASVGPSAPADR